MTISVRGSFLDADYPATGSILHAGSHFIGILLEHHEGKLPLWLAPRQVAVLPISRDQHLYAGEIHGRLRDAGFRSVLMDHDESLQRRLLEAHQLLVPVHLVVGRSEVAAGEVMLQAGGGRERKSVVALIAWLNEEAEAAR